MTPDPAARDVLAEREMGAALHRRGPMDCRDWPRDHVGGHRTDAREILDDLAAHGYFLHPASCPGPLDAEPHPGEPHEFRTTCRRCGEYGYLNISLITCDETVKIVARGGSEPEP